MYNGIREVDCTEEELAEFYEGKLKYELVPNQYLLIKKDGVIVDKYKMDKDGKIQKVKYKVIESPIMGKVKPRNVKQELYFDLLESDIPLSIISGQAGCGKTFVATCFAIQELEKRKYDKILFLRNNIPIEGTGELGILPGDANSKLRGYFSYVADILNPFMFENLITQGKVEIAWLGDMRGRNISNAIVLCSESQNLTKSLVKMIVSRMGENTRLIFDLDWEQVDNKKYEKDSGMASAIESLSGNPMFGVAELDLVERSPLARLASLIK